MRPAPRQVNDQGSGSSPRYRCSGSVGALLLLCGGVALSAAAQTRTASIGVVNRLGEDVTTATFCSGTSVACVALAARWHETGYSIALPDREADVVRVRAPGYEEAIVPPGASAGSRVLLRARGRFEARFEFDRVLVGAKVSVRLERALPPPAPAVAPFWTSVVVGNGEGISIREGDLPAGQYLLSWDGRDVQPGSRRIDLRVVEEVSVGAISVRAGRSVDGFVLDADGVPVPGARVELVPSTGTASNRVEIRADVNGAFRVDGLPLDVPFDYVVSAARLLPEHGTLGATSRLIVSLRPAPRVIGRLLSRGSPVNGAEVEITYVVREEPLETESEAGPRSGEDGRFELFRKRGSRASLGIRARGFRPLRPEIPAGNAEALLVDLGDLELSPGREVTGVVRSKTDGRPVAGATVSGHAAGEESAASASTDSDGSFVLHGLPEKAAVGVVATAPGRGSATKTVPSGIDFVELELAAGGRVEGRACGSPAEIAEIRISLERAARIPGLQPQTTAPDPDGEFRFAEVEPGDWHVSKEWRAATGDRSYATIGTSEMRPVSVSADATARTSIGCEGLPLTGRVLVNGSPFAGAYGELTLEGRPVAPLRTDGAGGFMARVPRAAAYYLTIVFPTSLSALSPSEDRCVAGPGGATGCDFRFFAP